MKSKYEDHERMRNGYRNTDMKDFQSKHGDMEGFIYGVIVGVLIFMAVLSWATVRDNHPFNEQIEVAQK